MNESMSVLRECAHRVEAETIRIRLAADGIRAHITGTDSATALSMGGAGTDRLVRIEVARSDLERADRLLQEDEERLRQAGPWTCYRCHEPNERAFEICWSCSKPRGDEDQAGGSSLDGEPLPSLTVPPQSPESTQPSPLESDDNPYRPVLLGNSPTHDGHAVTPDTVLGQASRAYHAAIVGAIVFPPLISFYSLFLLTGLLGRVPMDDRVTKRKVLAAWVINVVVIPTWLFLWTTMF